MVQQPNQVSPQLPKMLIGTSCKPTSSKEPLSSEEVVVLPHADGGLLMFMKTQQLVKLPLPIPSTELMLELPLPLTCGLTTQ